MEKEPLKTLLQSCALLLSFLKGPLLSEEAVRHCSETVCVRVCFGFLETAPPRCEAETQAAGAADAHRLFTSRGDREGENKRETIAEKSQERWIAPRNSARHMSLVPPL